MAHRISIVNGRAELAYAGETPWHGLGVKVAGESTADGMLEAAGMKWTVGLESLMLADGRAVDGYRAIVRQDTAKPLGVVTDHYQPIQNEQAGDVMSALIAEGATVQVAGVLDAGERCWMLAKIPGDFEVTRNDVVKPYVLLAWGHDGKHGLAAKLTPIRVVCHNTLTAALGDKWAKSADVYIKHTKSATVRLEEARRALGIAQKQMVETAETYRALAVRAMTAAEMISYTAGVFPYPPAEFKPGATVPEVDVNARARINEQRAGVLTLLDSGNGHELAGRTAWGAYNAVTEWVDRVYPVTQRGDVSKIRQESALFGAYATVKARALASAITLL